MIDAQPPATLVIEQPIQDFQSQLDDQLQATPNSDTIRAQEAEGQELGKALSDMFNSGESLSQAMQQLVQKYPNLILDIHMELSGSAQGQSMGGTADFILQGDGKGEFNLVHSNVQADSSQASINNDTDIIRTLLSSGLNGTPRVSISASGGGYRMNGIPGIVKATVVGINDGSTPLGNVSKTAGKSSFTYSASGMATVAKVPANLIPHPASTSQRNTDSIVVTPTAKAQIQAQATATVTPPQPKLPVAINGNSPWNDNARANSSLSAQAAQSPQVVTPNKVNTPESVTQVFDMSNIVRFQEGSNININLNTPFRLSNHPNVILTVIPAPNGRIRVIVLDPSGKKKPSNQETREEGELAALLYARAQYSGGNQVNIPPVR